MSLSGLLLALEATCPRSTIFVFTDAISKDYNKLGLVLDAIQRRQIRVRHQWFPPLAASFGYTFADDNNRQDMSCLPIYVEMPRRHKVSPWSAYWTRNRLWPTMLLSINLILLLCKVFTLGVYLLSDSFSRSSSFLAEIVDLLTIAATRFI